MLAMNSGEERDTTYLPEWYAIQPVHEAASFITGKSTASNLTIARQQAAADALKIFTNVIENALEPELGQIRITSDEAISQFVAKSFTTGIEPFWEKRIAKDDFYYSKNDTFTAFVLIQIDIGLMKDIYDLYIAPGLEEPYLESTWEMIANVMRSNFTELATDQRQLKSRAEIEKYEAGVFSSDFENYATGNLLLQKGSFKSAIAKLSNIVESQHDFYLATYSLAKAYQMAGDNDLAKEFYERSVFLERHLPAPLHDASLYYALGQYYEIIGDIESALANYGEAMKIDPDHAYALKSKYQLLR